MWKLSKHGSGLAWMSKQEQVCQFRQRRLYLAGNYTPSQIRGEADILGRQPILKERQHLCA